MNEPALYAKCNALPRHVINDLLNEFADGIEKMSGRCIDVGSGPGDVVADLLLPKLNTKATIVCSDLSEGMIEYAKERYGDNQRMSFIQLDIESPNLSQCLVERFDNVTSFYCIHWCQNIRQVLKNIFNLLRPSGTTFVIFASSAPFFNAFKSLAAIPRYTPYMKDADRYIPVFQHAERPREDLIAILKDVGFEIQHCSSREKSWIFDTREDFREFMVSLNPFIERMPADVKKEYEEDLVRETANQNIVFNKNNNNDDDYSVLMRHNVLVLYCTKPTTLYT